MKKIMFAAAMIAATAAVADVTSANVVGYTSVTNKSCEYQIGGSMFTEPGKDYYDLTNIAITLSVSVTAAKARRNYIQFVKPGSLVMDDAQAYYYYNGKWLYKNTTATTTAGTEVGNIQIPKNQAFLCDFDTRDGAAIRVAGQVQKGTVSTSAPAGTEYFFVVNPCARAVDLTECSITLSVSATAAKARRNYIQFVKPGSLVMDDTQAYYYYNGKWLYKNTTATTTAGSEVPEGTVVFAVGEGALCDFDSRDGASMVFPAPLAAD